MGITAFEIKLLDKVIEQYHPKTVCELGSQNIYVDSNPQPPFASSWYILEKGLERYVSIDLAGDNYSEKEDLSKSICWKDKFDLVTDFGTSEHVVQMEDYVSVPYHEGYINSIYPKGVKGIEQGYYNCWLNKHTLLAIGGIMVNVNPKTKMWEGHGYTYLGVDFYKELEAFSGYELLETGLNGAMGNWETGVNVYGILRKEYEYFPDFGTFKKLPIFRK